MINDDLELVRRFAQTESEEAFAALASRHVNLVYSVALRQVRDPHLAEEITQTVFVILARKAASLSSKTVLSGWLCRTARHVSARALTLQRRRRHREQEAYMQSQSTENEADAWRQIEPLLEPAMAQLGGRDHDAIALRFLEGRGFKEVSAALGTSEAGAKMRVARALEKLRKFFTKRGLTLSTTLIAGAVAGHSVQAAPIGLATAVTAAAVKGTAVTASTATLIETTLKIMAWTKIKTTLVVGALAIIAAGTSVTILHLNASASRTPFSLAGYATPEAAMQSTIWGASLGDLAKISAGVTPEMMAGFQARMNGKSDDEVRLGLKAWANAMAGYKITQTDVISPDEVHLHIHATPSAEALHSGKSVMRMKKIDGGWKVDGDVN